ncbi:uncharacterized protein LOC135218760 [Macrobrachium nipponense]|uniref:uncharacterized protein LOC135218760 n=1 Tax=Macrobrachium nipponense TaxID=159736 RepID=UPI0030C8A0D5
MAYNPSANSMVERTHHSLKASLMACCTGPDWKAQLPWVLLGLHTAPRANGDPSQAEKVYGETLTLPGEFFAADNNDPNVPLARLRAVTQKLVPCREPYTYRRQQFRPRALDFCKYIFIRYDAIRQPLTRPYRGPHCIIRREEKALLISIGGSQDWVSIDRLKPAVISDEDDPAEGPRRTPPWNTALPESDSTLRHRRESSRTP